MSSAYQIDIELVQSIFYDIAAKSIANSSFIIPPPSDIRVRIRPEDITEKPFIRNLNGSLDIAEIIDTIEVRRKPSMHTQNLFINKRHNGHGIENIYKILPDLEVIASLTLITSLLTLIVEAIDAIDAGTLMVAPEQKEVLRELDLIAKQEHHALNGVFSSVDIIPNEEIVTVSWPAPVFEHFQEVDILPMYIS